MDASDIMINIKDEELEDLARMYKPYEDKLPHVYSFIKTCIKSKKIGGKDMITLMSPKDCWREDGTFFAVIKDQGHDIIIHSLDPSGKNVVHGLIHTKRLNLPLNEKYPFSLLYAIHETFYPKIVDVLKNVLNLAVIEHTTTMYSLKKEKAINLSINLPPDVYIKELSLTNIPLINNAWPHKYPGSEKKIENFLKLNNGYGVYLKSNDQLVSWALRSLLGQLTAVQTLDGYKKRGYGTLIVSYVSKKIAEDGFNCIGTVIVGNRSSEQLFEKLGFEKLALCNYIKVKISN